MIKFENEHLLSAGKSQKYFEKERNGDHFLIQAIDKRYLALIVADGVSRQPCDWKASETVCKAFAKSLASKSNLSSATIADAVLESNQELLNDKTPCAGGHTTFSALIVDQKETIGYWVNLGDSRIFRYNGEALEQLSKDDTTTHNFTVHKENSSSTLAKGTLTNALGGHHPTIQVNTLKLTPKDLILLASDGFYGAKPLRLAQDIQDIYNNENPISTFETIFDSYDWAARDDMTAVLFQLIG